MLFETIQSIRRFPDSLVNHATSYSFTRLCHTLVTASPGCVGRTRSSAFYAIESACPGRIPTWSASNRAQSLLKPTASPILRTFFPYPQKMRRSRRLEDIIYQASFRPAQARIWLASDRDGSRGATASPPPKCLDYGNEATATARKMLI